MFLAVCKIKIEFLQFVLCAGIHCLHKLDVGMSTCTYADKNKWTSVVPKVFSVLVQIFFPFVMWIWCLLCKHSCVCMHVGIICAVFCDIVWFAASVLCACMTSICCFHRSAFPDISLFCFFYHLSGVCVSVEDAQREEICSWLVLPSPLSLTHFLYTDLFVLFCLL